MNFFDLLNATADEIVILDATVDTRCPFCGKRHSIEVNEADYFDWQDGKCAQDAFPYLSADDREMLISGICPTCWSKTFDAMDIEDSLYDGDEE